MALSTSVPFSCSADPLDYELLNQGRVLIIKDALYNPVTQKYHDIQLLRSGRKFLGREWGGGSFDGITDDAVRQIQDTYGIVFKTLKKDPPGVAFWGDERKTTYITESENSRSFWSRPKTSYPYGKSDEVLLSAEDAARFGKSRMTLHEAIRAGIWNAAGWTRNEPAFDPEVESEEEPVVEEEKTGPAQYGSAIERPKRATDPEQNNTTRSWLMEKPGKKTPAPIEEEDSPPLEPAPKKTAADRLKQRSALGADVEMDELEPIERKTAPKGKTFEALKHPAKLKPIESVPWIPAYRAYSTPKEHGYDHVPLEERRGRIIGHLDRSSPIPFSAFVDNNKERKIHPILFQTQLDALRRLAKDPGASDSDAQDMLKLLQNWFRAAYHYLDQNSKPHTLNLPAEDKDPKRAERKAKEAYWRKHATDFWMTLVDLFSAEKIDIEPLHKALSSQTSLHPWF